MSQVGPRPGPRPPQQGRPERGQVGQAKQRRSLPRGRHRFQGRVRDYVRTTGTNRLPRSSGWRASHASKTKTLGCLTLDAELLEAKYSTVAQRPRIRDEVESPPFAARSFAGVAEP